MKRMYILSLSIMLLVCNSCNKDSNSIEKTGAIIVPKIKAKTDIIIAGKIVPTTLNYKDDDAAATTPVMQLDQYQVSCTIYAVPPRSAVGAISETGEFAVLLSEAKDLPFSCYMLNLDNEYKGFFFFEDRSLVGLGDDEKRSVQLKLADHAYYGTIEFDPARGIGRIDKTSMTGLTVYAGGSADILETAIVETPVNTEQVQFDFNGTWQLWDITNTNNFPGNIPAALQPTDSFFHYKAMAQAGVAEQSGIPDGMSLFYAPFQAKKNDTGYIISGLQVWQDLISFQTCGGRIGADMVSYGYTFLDSNVVNGAHLWTATYVDSHEPFNGWRVLDAVDPDAATHLPCSFYSGLDQYQCFASYYYSDYNGFKRSDNTKCLRQVYFDWTATDVLSFVKTANDIPKAINEYILEAVIYTDYNSGSFVSYNEEKYGFKNITSYKCTVQLTTISNFVAIDTDSVSNNEALGDLVFIRALSSDSDAQCFETSDTYKDNRQMSLGDNRYLIYFKKQ